MFNFLKSKKKEGDEDNLDAETEDSDNSENAEDKEKENSNSKKDSIESSSGAPSLLKISTEVDRLKAVQEAFQEVRKSFTERFTHLSEQIGELRSMILDRDRTIQTLELKSVKAIDLVESIKPDKFMMDLERQNVKIEDRSS